MSKIKRITTTSVNDYKVAVDSSDTNPDYLNDKLNAGDNVTLTAETVDGDKVVTIAAVSTNTTLDSLTDVTGTTTEGQVLTRGSSGYEFEYPKVRTTNTISSTTALTTTTITDYVTLTPAVSTEIRLTLPNASTMPAGSIVEIRFEAPTYTASSSETAAEAEIYADAAVLFHMNADGETAKLIAGASSWSILSRNYPKTSVEETTSGNTTLYIRNESYLHVTHTSSGSETLNIQMPNISETRQVWVFVKASGDDVTVNLKDKTGSTVDSFFAPDGAEFNWSLTADDDATGYNYTLTQKVSSSVVDITVDTTISLPVADRYIVTPSSTDEFIAIKLPTHADIVGKEITFILGDPGTYASDTDEIYVVGIDNATGDTVTTFWESGTEKAFLTLSVTGESVTIAARSNSFEVIKRTYPTKADIKSISATDTSSPYSYYWRNCTAANITFSVDDDDPTAVLNIYIPYAAGLRWMNKPLDAYVKVICGSLDDATINIYESPTDGSTLLGSVDVGSDRTSYIHFHIGDLETSQTPFITTYSNAGTPI